MSDIFISYKQEERSIARQFADALEKLGWSVWWDPELRAGEHFDDIIQAALEEARCVVVLWSNMSVKSRYVKDEATYALDEGKLTPIAIEPVTLSFRFRGLHTPELYDWDGSDTNPSFNELINHIEDRIGLAPLHVEEERKRVEEEQRRKEKEEEAKRRAEEEKAKRQAEKEKQKQAEEEDKRKAEEERQQAEKQRRIDPEARQKFADKPKPTSALQTKYIVAGIVGLVILIVTGTLMMNRPSPKVSYEPTAVEPAKTKELSKQTTELRPETSPDAGSVHYSSFEWKDIQKALNDIGFDAGESDGIPGFKTRSAIKLFQESRGFPIGELTLGQRERLFSDAKEADLGRLGDAPAPDTDSAILPEMVRVGSFSIGKYEVTQGEWKAVMGNNPSRFDKGDEYPVEQLSWDDVQEYIRRLNANTGKRYRLPTEEEWEIACHGGGQAQKYCGGEDIDELGWYAGNSNSSTHPVGRKRPNRLGIYDMSGNVREWTSSPYESSNLRVIRGGSWSYGPGTLRSALRAGFYPALRGSNLGFRLAQDL